MKNQSSKQNFNLLRAVKKLFLSVFVVGSFILYALNKPDNNSASNLGMLAPTPSDTPSPQELTPTSPPAPTQAPTTAANTAQQGLPSNPIPTAVPSTAVPPTSVPPSPTPNAPLLGSQYRDGTYTGTEVDAIYGLVKVQTTIQNGKIVNVQFLEYPNDRRTSVRINSFAVPYLQQEAVQAQSANVDLITGATLTSEAFQMSLQSALNKAKGTL